MLNLVSNITTHILPSFPFYSEGEAEEPVMIIGCGRSGNTLLRSMLVAGGEVTIPPESYVLASISRHYNLWRFKGWSDICDLVVNKLVSYPEFKTWQIDVFDVLSNAYGLPDDQRSLLSILKLVYMKYGQVHGYGLSRWGDKTPLNTLYLKEIGHMMPQAKFVHMVRDPRAVACSYVAAAEKNKTIKESSYELATQRWLASVKAVEQFKKSKQGVNLIEVKYEDLVTSPEREMKRICDFVGLLFSDKMLRHNVTQKHLGDVDQHEHHKSVQSPIDSSKAAAWKDKVSSEDQKQVEKVTKNLAAAYGYI